MRITLKTDSKLGLPPGPEREAEEPRLARARALGVVYDTIPNDCPLRQDDRLITIASGNGWGCDAHRAGEFQLDCKQFERGNVFGSSDTHEEIQETALLPRTTGAGAVQISGRQLDVLGSLAAFGDNLQKFARSVHVPLRSLQTHLTHHG